MDTYLAEADVGEVVQRLAGVGEIFKGSRVLISGGAGFLGRYLVETLKRFGAQRIVVVDTLVTTGPLGEIMSHDPSIEFIRCDVAKFASRSDVQYDFVIHAAALTSPHYYKKFPLETLEASIAGTRNMLELASAKGARVLHFSTSEAYGDPDSAHVPTREDYRGNANTMGPRAPYDEGKRVSETLAWIYHTHHNVPVVVVRPFNVYGPTMWEEDYRCMPNFASRLKRGKPLQVYQTGRQTRTFCFITDAIVGFLLALAKGTPGEAYNIGSPGPEITILELAECMGEIAARRPVIQVVDHPIDYPADEPQRRCPDISKARRDLGFEPIVSLRDGLRRFLTWTETHYGAERARTAGR